MSNKYPTITYSNTIVEEQPSYQGYGDTIVHTEPMYTNRTSANKQVNKKSRNANVVGASTSEFMSKDSKYTMRPSYYMKGGISS